MIVMVEIDEKTEMAQSMMMRRNSSSSGSVSMSINRDGAKGESLLKDRA